MAYFPMFTDIKNKKCLVVGGGSVAKRKADTLLNFGANVIVIAKEIKYDFVSCTVYKRKFENSDIDGCFIVIAATDDREANHEIAELCNSKNINVNVCDSSDDSSFIFGATSKINNMVIAVNSGENNPSKSKKVRDDIMKGLRTIRIGTRKSRLAKIQTDIVANLIKNIDDNINIEIVELSTVGDINLDKNLTEFGGKGAFTGEFERALINDEIDIAVHSAKDLPVELAEGLEILAVPAREKANDVLVTLKGKVLDNNSVIGTSSIRRSIQIPYKTKNIRGNVETRLAKMENGEYDGVILAYAGLKRLGMENVEKYSCMVFDTDKFYPAPCQGIIAVEGKKNNRFADIFSKINDETAYTSFLAERMLLKELGLGCQVPLGAYSYIENDELVLKAVYLCDNNKYIEARDKDPEKAALKIAFKIKENL